MRILLVGYYGQGNFGDDVLFQTSFSCLRELFPHADIDVQSEAENPDYLQGLAKESVRIVRIGEAKHYDLIFHGGGGTFFDFDEGNLIDQAINRAMRVLGLRRSSAVFETIRRAMGRSGLISDQRIGVGIGIGTHSVGSRKLRYHLRALHDFDFLAVRDEASVTNARRLGLSDPILGTDLAFAAPALAGLACDHISESNAGPVVILRGWKHKRGRALQDRLVTELSAMTDLPSPAYLLLDRHDDNEWLERLPAEMTHIYKPGNINEVMQLLSRSSCWISARAHGAICGAIAGRPGIVLPIEPKLELVDHMLGPASCAWTGVSGTLRDRIGKVIEIEDSQVAAAVEKQREIIKSTLNDAFRSCGARVITAATPAGKGVQ